MTSTPYGGSLTMGPSGSSARVSTAIGFGPPSADHLSQLHVHGVDLLDGSLNTDRLVETQELGSSLCHLEDAVHDLHDGVDVRDRIAGLQVHDLTIGYRVVILIDQDRKSTRLNSSH